jgi:N-acetylmuramoyl-L-alanine amidase
MLIKQLGNLSFTHCTEDKTGAFAMKSCLFDNKPLYGHICIKNKILAGIAFFAILLLSYNSGNSMAAAIAFTDIQSHWAQADINIAVNTGYIKGYVDSTFRPDKPVSRAEFVSMLNAAFKVSMSGIGSSYKDIKSSDWFAGDIESAVNAGYMDIYAGDTFIPNQPLTRQEAAVLTSNLTKIVTGDERTFKDGDQIEVWAKQQVYALVSAGILNGNPDGYFMPYAEITRAEAVALINRAKTYKDSTPYNASLTVTGSTVNIRSGPDTSYSVVTKVNRGNKLNVLLHSSNDWYKVTIDGLSGWIIGGFVAVSNIAGRGGAVDRGDSSNSGTGPAGQNASGGGTDPAGQNASDGGTDPAGQNASGGGTDPAGQNASDGGTDPAGQNASDGGTDPAGQNSSDGGTSSAVQNGLEDGTSSAGQPDSAVSDNSGEVTGPSEGMDQNSGSSKLVVIDAGHGGYDIGASGLNGALEKDINLAIALKLSDYLKNAGYNILLTRSDDTFVSLKDRSAAANNANADIFISIHCNVSLNHEAGGTEVLTEPASLNPVYDQQEDSKHLAGLVQEELVKVLGLKNRGVKDQDLSVCRETNAPAILIETAFIDNSYEEKLINDTAVQDKVSAAIKIGIDNYFAKH